ncbi:MAG: ATP-binding protein, partial [Candidatus Nitrosocosmicus sp.]
MALELKVHPSFFREFATKTWISTYDILRELIENAFDEDATKVIVTILSNGNVVIEDDAGMNFDSINKFLVLGSPHKSNENLSPKFKRIRTGRYGTGRLSFLTSFDSMKIKTKLDEFNKTLVINGNSLENLASGKAQLQELQEPPLKRNGTEILLKGSKIHLDVIKLSKEIKKLSILKYPLFDVYIKNSEHFREWDIEGSQIVKSPDVQGYKIVVNIVEPHIMGEIIIAKRPLGIDEKGIAIMVGNHMVLRSTFGFENKLNRVTGYVKCDQLTSRFADKSALIENDIYFKFNQSMKDFIVNEVLPSLTEYEDVLITREESKIYKEIDKVMGQAVLETLQIDEEVDGFESVEVSGIHTEFKGSTYADLTIQSSQSTSILQNRHIRENNSTKEKDESNF